MTLPFIPELAGPAAAGSPARNRGHYATWVIGQTDPNSRTLEGVHGSVVTLDGAAGNEARRPDRAGGYAAPGARTR
jgi:hypothetical protein